MRKSSYKALYNFTKMQKLKQNTSIRDLQDSLDNCQVEDCKNVLPSLKKKFHNRTQSCPSIPEGIELIQHPMNNYCPSTIKPSEKSKIPRKALNKKFNQILFQDQKSQVSLESGSISANSLSNDEQSTVAYGKIKNEMKISKKSDAILPEKVKTDFLRKNASYMKTKLSQQIKAYQLTEQLQNIKKKSADSDLKQQVFIKILQKYQ